MQQCRSALHSRRTPSSSSVLVVVFIARHLEVQHVRQFRRDRVQDVLVLEEGQDRGDHRADLDGLGVAVAWAEQSRRHNCEQGPDEVSKVLKFLRLCKADSFCGRKESAPVAMLVRFMRLPSLIVMCAKRESHLRRIKRVSRSSGSEDPCR